MRLPVPDAEAKQAGETELRRLFKAELDAARTSEMKTILAQRFAQLARETHDEAIMRFVLFNEAIRLAVEGGQVAGALSLVDEQAREYETDAIELKANAVATIAPRARTPLEYRQLIELAVSLARAAVAEDKMTAADRLLDVATVTARKLADQRYRLEVANQVKLFDEWKAKAKAGLTAAERLKSTPDDPEANLAYGRYLCLVRSNWPTGLAHVAKGNHEGLQKLASADAAQQEFSLPQQLDALLVLADQWWDLGEATAGDDKLLAKARAYFWYERALPHTIGLMRARVEKRMESIPAAVSAPC
jgi:hypothetical protein